MTFPEVGGRKLCVLSSAAHVHEDKREFGIQKCAVQHSCTRVRVYFECCGRWAAHQPQGIGDAVSISISTLFRPCLCGHVCDVRRSRLDRAW